MKKNNLEKILTFLIIYSLIYYHSYIPLIDSDYDSEIDTINIYNKKLLIIIIQMRIKKI